MSEVKSKLVTQDDIIKYNERLQHDISALKADLENSLKNCKLLEEYNLKILLSMKKLFQRLV